MYEHNGQEWYKVTESPLKRARRWLVSTGLETIEDGAAGYTHRWDRPLEQIRRSIRTHPGRAKAFGVYTALSPLSLFGGRVVFQPFGVDIPTRRGWLCLHYKIVNPGPKWRKQWYAYRSPNATPRAANRWYFGAPQDVQRQAIEQQQARAARRAS